MTPYANAHANLHVPPGHTACHVAPCNPPQVTPFRPTACEPHHLSSSLHTLARTHTRQVATRGLFSARPPLPGATSPAMEEVDFVFATSALGLFAACAFPGLLLTYGIAAPTGGWSCMNMCSADNESVTYAAASGSATP